MVDHTSGDESREPLKSATNRLANQHSPYLLQRSKDPVQWYPWGQEALATAKAADKPILLSIGYASCRASQLMGRESFTDPNVANLMNEHFINIKVDRDERPDLDKVYQITHQLLHRSAGGWPLTAFLDPTNPVSYTHLTLPTNREV